MTAAADGHVLAERYDELRRGVLHQGIPVARGEGLALFLRQGMANWMSAWPGLTPERKGLEKSEKVVNPPKPPLDHKRELTGILSAMVMKSLAGNF